MRAALAGLLGLILPGAGHLYLGRRRVAALFVAPVVLLVVGVLFIVVTRGPVGLLAIVVTPGVLPALFVLNVALAIWRIGAGIDAARRVERTRIVMGSLAIGMVVLVVVPHAIAGEYIASTSDFLDSMFASAPDDSTDPLLTSDATPTVPSGYGPSGPFATLDPGSNEPSTAEPSATPAGPTRTPRPTGPFTSGTGTLPSLNASIPWPRPGAIPWGDDGRFDLLLLGSDAGTDRWSRRMDVMLLVEIDVASGKVAMIGLPRNLVNAPFPPGAARDAVACGCFTNLLNALYVEATSGHPSRWPGSGAVKGIGAVRSVVSELTGRPIDAVLVADLWGVIKVVDAMGGIDIYVPSPVHDDNYPDPVWGSIVLNIKAGQQHMDGRTALAYARSRHQDSDYGRMARQQTFLLALRSQIGPATILKAPALFTAAKGFAWTDLPRSSLPSLVELFDKAAHATVKQLRIVPSRYPAWLTPSEITRIQADIAGLLGTVPPPTPAPSPSLEASPSVEPSSSAEPSPSGSSTPSASPSGSPVASSSPSPSPPPTATASASPPPTATASASPSPSPTATSSPSPSPGASSAATSGS